MRITTSFFCLFLFISGYLSAQSEQLSISLLGTEQGLSQGHVSSILKDQEGFVWIGTQDGLNRFNGFDFHTFYHKNQDANSIGNNYIWTLFQDSQQTIWIGTFGGGLSAYDPIQAQFSTYHPIPLSDSTLMQNAIRSITEVPGQRLWIGADEGLWQFDLRTRAFVSYPAQDSLQHLLNVTAVQPFGKSQLLVGSLQGLYLLPVTSTSSRDFQSLQYQAQHLTEVTHIYTPDEQIYWLTARQGLFYFRKEQAEKIFRFDGLPPNIRINQILKDQQTYWLATNEGLFRFPENRAPQEVQHFHTGNSALPSNLVQSITAIEPGLLWAGTRAGIAQINIESPPFAHFLPKPEDEERFSKAFLGIKSQDSLLWLGSRNGLFLIQNADESVQNWTYDVLHPQFFPEMPYHYVINLHQGPSGQMWVAFRQNGFASLRHVQGRWVFEQPTTPQLALKGIGVNALVETSKGELWIGSAGLGLYRWDIETDHVQRFSTKDVPANGLQHDYFFCLFEDQNQQIWAGTANGGLCKYLPATQQFECYLHDAADQNSISSNMVLSIMQDQSGQIWICTAQGLNRLKSDGTFQRFGRAEGLPNEVIYSMVEDEHNHFWISTNRGITQMTWKNGEARFQNFDLEDGLQDNEFNQHAYERLPDGRLVFGGPNGLNVFAPDDIQADTILPIPAFTDFQLFNESVPVASEFLPNHINHTDRIELPHNQNFIAFEFAALGYHQSEANQYAYRLEGLDPDWIESGTRRFASYAKLAPGDYTFQLKVANHDHIWNPNIKSVHIIIHPPWWKTWWAIIAYLIVGSLIFWLIIRYRENQIRLIESIKQTERERFRKKAARDFHDEAGNKITKLSLLAAVIRNHLPEQLPLVQNMESHIQELRSGMRDFIWVLDPDKDSLEDTLTRIRDFGNQFFEYSTTRFVYFQQAHLPLQQKLSSQQRRHLLLIFKEIMHNCIKHAQAQKASLSVEYRDKQLLFLFEDDGIGFAQADTTGNGLQNLKSRAQKLSAQLDIHSAKAKGTTIQLLVNTTHLGD
ncbi:MAG: hypothetical protein MRY78_16890 [Saprospiraceae bacterium]|nr:hypothetical protein [Saprospiraceae bacterium]